MGVITNLVSVCKGRDVGSAMAVDRHANVHLWVHELHSGNDIMEGEAINMSQLTLLQPCERGMVHVFFGSKLNTFCTGVPIDIQTRGTLTQSEERSSHIYYTNQMLRMRGSRPGHPSIDRDCPAWSPSSKVCARRRTGRGRGRGRKEGLVSKYVALAVECMAQSDHSSYTKKKTFATPRRGSSSPAGDHVIVVVYGALVKRADS